MKERFWILDCVKDRTLFSYDWEWRQKSDCLLGGAGADTKLGLRIRRGSDGLVEISKLTVGVI